MCSNVLIILIVVFSSFLGNAQYINRLIVPGENAVTLGDIYSTDSGYYLAYLYTNGNTTSSGVSKLSIHGEITDKVLLPNIRYAKRGLHFINERLFFYGKYASQESNLILAEINLFDYDFTILQSLNSDGCSTFPFLGLSINEDLFLGYTCNTSDPNHKDYGLVKYHPGQGILFNQRYNSHIKFSNLDVIDTMNSQVLIASKRQGSPTQDVAFLLELNSDGEVIDSFQSEIQINDFTDDVYMTVLSDNRIVIGYRIDESGDDVPIQLEFLDGDFNKVGENRIFNTLPMRITPSAFVKGKGDYFFCYGSFIDYDIDEGFGYIAKLDFDGNVLWQHKYQHPDFSQIDDYSSISSMIEEENGDLTCVGNILRLGDPFTGWMFRVNEFGCFGGEDCDEIVVGVDDFKLHDSIISVFPNPSVDQLIVRSENIEITKISIRSSNSKLLAEQSGNYNETLIDISSYPSGWYSVMVILKNGDVVTKKIVKP